MAFTDKGGFTPLMRAAEFGHAGVVSALIRLAGSDKSCTRAVTHAGDTALLLAAAGGHSKVVAVLANHDAGASTLMHCPFSSLLFSCF